MKWTRRVLATAVLATLTLAACSSSDDDSGAKTTTSATKGKGVEPLEIMVTNDDGYAADGIDTIVEALRAQPDVEVTVVAPATDKSGTGSQTTSGTLTASEQETKSGYPAMAVDGFPADTVTYALDEVYAGDHTPDLVVSGINKGQNLGPISDISGTVGAAKAAVTAGIPAVAVSQGLADTPDYAAAAAFVVEWIEDHRQAIERGTLVPTVLNLNTPTCALGTRIRGLKQVPLAVDGAGAVDPSDCASTATDLADDIAAFLAGYATITELTAEGAEVTPTTTWQPAG